MLRQSTCRAVTGRALSPSTAAQQDRDRGRPPVDGQHKGQVLRKIQVHTATLLHGCSIEAKSSIGGANMSAGLPGPPSGASATMADRMPMSPGAGPGRH